MSIDLEADPQRLVAFAGRLTADMTREELIEALQHASRLNSGLMSPARAEAEAVGRVELMKRGRL